MKNKVLIGLQLLLVVIWALASFGLDKGFNLFVFNILPIPNFGLVIISIVLVIIGYWLQGMKDKKPSTR